MLEILQMLQMSPNGICFYPCGGHTAQKNMKNNKTNRITIRKESKKEIKSNCSRQMLGAS